MVNTSNNLISGTMRNSNCGFIKRALGKCPEKNSKNDPLDFKCQTYIGIIPPKECQIGFNFDKIEAKLKKKIELEKNMDASRINEEIDNCKSINDEKLSERCLEKVREKYE